MEIDFGKKDLPVTGLDRAINFVRDVLIAGNRPRHAWKQEALAAGVGADNYQRAVRRLCGSDSTDNRSAAQTGRTKRDSKAMKARQFVLALIADGYPRKDWENKARSAGIDPKVLNHAIAYLRRKGVAECAYIRRRRAGG